MGVMIEAACSSWTCFSTLRRPMGVVEEPTFTLYYCKVCGRTKKIERKTLADTQREMSWLRKKLCSLSK